MNSIFGGLSVTDFAPDESPNDNALPKWKKITAPVNFYEAVTATVFVQSGTVSDVEMVPLANTTQVSEDLMLNAIQSVVWETVEGLEEGGAIKLGNNPNDDGKCCFPEKDAPNGTLHNEINVKVTLNVAIPPQMKGTLHLDWFDPDNPIGSLVEPTTNGHGLRDNYGSITLTPTMLEFTASDNGVKYALCTFVKAHAGDNYIVAVHPNEGVVEKYVLADEQQCYTAGSGVVGRTLLYPLVGGLFGGYALLPLVLQTQANTVWKSLWLELDGMKGPDPNIPMMDSPLEPDPSSLIAAMKDAHVEAKKVLPDRNPRPMAQHKKFLAKSDLINNFKDVSASCRDIKLEQVTNDYWCIHGIGAYTGTPIGALGVATYISDGGSFFLYWEAICAEVNKAPAMYIGNDQETKRKTLLSRTTYHEIMHYFGFEDIYNVGAILNKIANDTGKTVPELKSILEEHRGYIIPFVLDQRIKDLYHDPNHVQGPDAPWLDLLQAIGTFIMQDPTQGIMDFETLRSGVWNDIKLTPDQIKKIQSLSKPIPPGKAD